MTEPSPAAAVPESRRHLPALDGLRGIAILVVVLVHASEAMNRLDELPRSLFDVAHLGYSGVDLFFVLSGFLISGILIDARGSAGYFRVFYARRALRIFPLYYAYLAIIFLLLPLLPVTLPDYYHELRAHQAWYWLYASNIFDSIQATWRIDGGMTGHFWTLAVEEQFYLLWPAVVLLLSPKALRNLCIALVVLTPMVRVGFHFIGINPIAVYALTICRGDEFALGALLAMAWRSDVGRVWLRRAALPALSLGVAGLITIAVWRGSFRMYDRVVDSLGPSVWAVFYGSLLCAALAAPVGLQWAARAFRSGPLRFFGKYSYAMYVFHRPICGLAEMVIPFGAMRRSMGLGLAGALFTAAVLAASTGVALVSWWVLESRMLAFKDRFRYGTAPGALVAVPVKS